MTNREPPSPEVFSAEDLARVTGLPTRRLRALIRTAATLFGRAGHCWTDADQPDRLACGCFSPTPRRRAPAAGRASRSSAQGQFICLSRWR